MPNIVKHNRLINEKSPYLLQHAYNPVDWYPWGEEAFHIAKSKNKPVFLSIGYSACHWCHVMAHESFEDEGVAELLNQHFISIKVDREERPDVDNIYMNICQGLTGHGGWPLTIVMDADKRPFFAATYLPRTNRGGMAGMMELLPRIAELWQNERQSLLNSAEQISQLVQEPEEQSYGEPLNAEMFEQALKKYGQVFDSEWGGFGKAPKFPSPHTLLFLMRYYHFQQEASALNMVEKTLQCMYRGGIYDHVGFGFARYSTDRRWLVPHFEKMLYDNALLAIAYLEAYQLSGQELYANVSREIFTYVLRDMTHTDGGFYSAEDADSEGEEGKFYLWKKAEVAEILGDKAEYFCKAFDISKKGNFEGKNIPNLINNKELIDQKAELQEAREKLFNHREKRVKPLKDDKILTGWNGLMIAAMAMGARILKNKVYLEAAQEAVDFILTSLRRPDGRLLATYRQGKAEHLAYAADYAYFIWGLIELYEAGFDSKYLLTALELNEDFLKYFWDQKKAGFFFYGLDAEQLLSRPKEHYDGAVPSDNAVAAYNLLRLARLSGDSSLEDKAQQSLEYFAGSIQANPMAHSFWLLTASYQLFPGREVVIAGYPDRKDTLDALDYFHSRYDPNTVVVLKDEGNGKAWEEKADYLREMHSINNQVTAYICENFTCQEPLLGLDAIKKAGV